MTCSVTLFLLIIFWSTADLHYRLRIIDSNCLNHFQDGPFRGCSRMSGQKGSLSLPKICHTYPTKMTLDTVTFYLKKIQKDI